MYFKSSNLKLKKDKKTSKKIPTDSSLCSKAIGKKALLVFLVYKTKLVFVFNKAKLNAENVKGIKNNIITDVSIIIFAVPVNGIVNVKRT